MPSSFRITSISATRCHVVFADTGGVRGATGRTTLVEQDHPVMRRVEVTAHGG